MAETTEKITINLTVVDLGKIDLLVEAGFYANRTDFIKDAIRRGLDAHEAVVAEKIARNAGALGLVSLGRSDFERWRQSGEAVRLSVVGLLHIAADVPAALVDATVESCKVMGVLRASPEVKAVLARKQPLAV
jgi:Arc/MetJ-type ribon-helix-helix transcriptional regulator